MATTQLKGNDVQLGGTTVNVGDKAPAVTVVATDLSEKTIGGANGKKQLIIAVPSLDTEVCATETRTFNSKAAQFSDVDVTVVSMDLPFASKRFCSTEGIDLTVASDYRNKDFMNAYGTLIAEGPLAGVSARAIFVIDANGIITYKELVPEITAEPDYDSALAAL